MFKNLFKKLSPKQRQVVTVGGLLIMFAIIAVVISFGMNNGKKQGSKERRVVPQKKVTLLTEKVEKEIWVAAESQNIKSLEKSNEEMRGQLEKIYKDMGEMVSKEVAKNKTPPVPPPTPLKKLGKNVPPLPLPASGITPPPGATPYPSSIQEAQTGQQTGQPSGQTGRSSLPSVLRPSEGGSGIRSFKGEEAKKSKENTDALANKDKEPTTFLPAGSFMQATLLSGLDAPTSGGKSSEPYPVLMGVTDLSVLPNRFRMNLKECFIIGAGYGNISDERAYIRTETLSCVRTDGKVLEVDIKGHVTGEDGKLGLRGRLVSKQGQQIAMAIFAGTLSGWGTALQPRANVSLNLSSSDSDNKTGFSRPDFGNVMESGAMGGAGKALDMVAQHYLKMAEKLFPIIEIDAGRNVEIVVLKGQELKLAGTSPTKRVASAVRSMVGK